MAKGPVNYALKWNTPGPVASAFYRSKAFIRGIRGPIGGGKSAAACVRLFATACTQAPDNNNVRRTRFALVRNTYPELKSTTIKTWLDWFPEEVFGPVKWDSPITHTLTLPLPDGTEMECETLFLALDRPEDVKKLLSLELTAGFMNESRELPFEVFEAFTGRLGRYPSQKDRPENIKPTDWPTECYLLMDTNSPSNRHWWYELAEPQAKGHDSMMERLEATREELVKLGAIKEGQPLMEFFAQPSGFSDEAENIPNLRPGYYQFASIGKSEEWIRVHLKNEYGTTFAGKRVYPNYSDALHMAKAKLFAVKGVQLAVSFDYGLTPAAVFGQLTPRGQLKVIAELTSDGMGIRQFIEQVVLPFMARNFPDVDKRKMLATGDPAGDPGRDTDGISPADIVREYFPEYESARTNDPLKRQEAVNFFLTRIADGEASFRLSPECRTLHEGFIGGYHYRKLNTLDLRFLESPEKNVYSHPHDALQYLALLFYQPPTQKTQRSSGSRASGADSSTGY